MTIQRHGLSIGIERADDQFFLSLKARGKLTHDDYGVITPMVDSALAEVKIPHVKMLFDATELEGWEARAAWDDFKLGLKHGNQFDKIAIVGSKHWQTNMAKVAGWFISGDVRFFDVEADALDWLDTQL